MKKIWIWDHYSTEGYFDHGWREYWFSKYLIKAGYEPTVFCASTIHNSDKQIEFDGPYKEDSVDGIPYVFIKTPSYKGNGKARVKNMYAFYKGILKMYSAYAENHGKPDVIYASSVHPLTLVAGEKAAKKMHIPCICEVRDLWPESLVDYGQIKKDSSFTKFLYKKEKEIYTKADALIFTMEGGRQYIIDKGWDKQTHGGPVDLDKIHHINNGVDLEAFDHNKEHNIIRDDDLEDDSFKCVYTGSVRLVNDVGQLVKAAKIIQDSGHDNIKILVYGDGDQREELIKTAKDKNINNIIFKGRVPKDNIPYVISKCNLCIMHSNRVAIDRYGLSFNKSFEYLAAGRPILENNRSEYDYIEPNGAGIAKDIETSQQYADEITRFAEMSKDEYEGYCNAARKTAEEKYDFKILTDKLIKIINSTEQYN